jgi:hypothetical protein
MLDIKKLQGEVMERQLKKQKIYEQIYILLADKINKINSKSDYCQYVYTVPSYVYGVPIYDFNACMIYLINRLKKEKFKVQYIEPDKLFISWLEMPIGENDIPSAKDFINSIPSNNMINIKEKQKLKENPQQIQKDIFKKIDEDFVNKSSEIFDKTKRINYVGNYHNIQRQKQKQQQLLQNPNSPKYKQMEQQIQQYQQTQKMGQPNYNVNNPQNLVAKYNNQLNNYNRQQPAQQFIQSNNKAFNNSTNYNRPNQSQYKNQYSQLLQDYGKPILPPTQTNGLNNLPLEYNPAQFHTQHQTPTNQGYNSKFNSAYNNQMNNQLSYQMNNQIKTINTNKTFSSNNNLENKKKEINSNQSLDEILNILDDDLNFGQDDEFKLL